jgi:uncharacterized membrane protein YtjA (UPF0391 family)
MLMWVLIFLIVAIVAALLGFGGIAAAAAGIARIIFFIFLIVFIISLFFYLLGQNGSPAATVQGVTNPVALETTAPGTVGQSEQ